MSLPVRYIPHSVNLNTNGGVSAWIDEIESTGPDDGVALFDESGGSEVDREFVAAKDVVPVMPFSTMDLTFITTCGMAGVYISPAVNKPGLTAYGRELPLGSVPTGIATANHLKLSVSDGLLVPISISAGHNQVAKLALMLHAILGTTPTYSNADPMVFTAAQAISSGAGALTKLFTAGIVKYNSRLVQGITNLAVHFGLQVFKESDSGDVFPSHVSIIAREPKIEFTTRDVELITEVGDGVSLSTFAAYFRKVSQNGQRVAIGTNQHIGISGTAGMITPGAVSLAHKQAGAAAFTITPTGGGGATLLTLSSSAVIPAS